MKIHKRAGQARQVLDGDLAYQAMDPVDLREVEVQYTDQGVRLLGQVRADLARFKTLFEALDREDQEGLKKKWAHEEGLASVKLARDQVNVQDSEVFFALPKPESLDLEGSALTDQEEEDRDWLEGAGRYGARLLNRLPLSKRFFKEVHDYLLHADHNYQSNPGEFRRSQTWMGPGGGQLKDARFVPPPVERMVEALDQLETYIHQEGGPDPLVKSALIHYQLGVIHPFLDGNGRLARLINNFYLVELGILPDLIFPLSTILLKKVNAYYLKFLLVEKEGDFEGWIEFWLQSLEKTARQTILEMEALQD